MTTMTKMERQSEFLRLLAEDEAIPVSFLAGSPTERIPVPSEKAIDVARSLVGGLPAASTGRDHVRSIALKLDRLVELDQDSITRCRSSSG
jgi:hypothetical protein